MMQHKTENVSDFFRRYKETAWLKDPNGMIELYDDSVSIFDMWGKGFINGRAEWAVEITNWLTSLQEEKVNVIFDMIDIKESGHVAFASAIIQFQAISADNQIIRSMKNRISLGFTKKEGVWKVKHQHTSAPIDADLKAILDI